MLNRAVQIYRDGEGSSLEGATIQGYHQTRHPPRSKERNRHLERDRTGKVGFRV